MHVQRQRWVDADFPVATSVLCGVEPGVLAELFKLTGAVPSMSKEQFTILFVAEFDRPLCTKKLRDHGRGSVGLTLVLSLKLVKGKFIETVFQNFVFQ